MRKTQKLSRRPSPAQATAIIAAKDGAKMATTRVYLYLHKNVVYDYYYVAYAFVQCVNNDKLFFYPFPFDNLFYFCIGLDMVRSTGNLSSEL